MVLPKFLNFDWPFPARSSRLAFGAPAAPPSYDLLDHERIAVESLTVCLKLGEAGVTALAFSPDGTILAVGLSDGTAGFYHLKSRKWGLRTGRFHEGGVQAIAVTPDGKLLVTCGGGIIISDVQTGAIRRRLAVGASVGCVAISPDGKTLAAGTVSPNELADMEAEGGEESFQDGAGKPLASVFLWSLPSFRLQRKLMISGGVSQINFSQTQRLLVVSHREGAVFSLTSSKKIWRREGEDARAGSISPNGKIVEYDLEFWDIDAGKHLAGSILQHNHSAFSNSGRLVVTGNRNEGTSVFDGSTGKLIAELDVFEDFAALSPDGSLLAGGYRDFGTRPYRFDEIYLYRIDEAALRRIAYAREYPTKRQIAQKDLEAAISEGDVVRVKAALSTGADPNFPYPNPMHMETTLLARVIQDGQTDIAEALVKGGARFHPHDPDFAIQMLFNAVEGGSVAMVQWLLDRGVSLPTESGLLLHMAALCGHAGVIDFLLDHGAAIDNRWGDQGQTSLMSAAMSGSADAVRMLLERGANATLRSIVSPGAAAGQPMSALGYAINSRNVETIQLLIDTSPDLTETDLFAALSYDIIRNERGPELLQLLIAHGADPNARGNGGAPLIRASKLASVDCVAVLLAHGADVNMKDDDGKTALDWSTNPEITKMLIAAIPKTGES
ncbi:hypothetical protein CCAX7_56150 [Capsulimonas corticalis]|uniref:Uncharacterized protein n=1 Tax=Capsulimonas corticalis TaxID=2219043 RepID=A0A402D0S3_9BACT|nr:ankyrin repeat domain-containing protein [Capsulimonas corticalis]BDI33564.1 hypothetical protein CCAX7_56150 [Capsulimonas corticalis]